MSQSTILTPKPFFPIVMATTTIEQTISNATWATVTLPTEYLDIFNAWNTTTYIFTAPKTAIYRIFALTRISITGHSGAVDLITGININNSATSFGIIQRSYNATSIGIAAASGLIPFYTLNQNDTASFRVFVSTGGIPVIKLQPLETQICIEIMQ